MTDQHTPAIAALEKMGAEHRVVRTSPARSAIESAELQGVAPEQLLKTIVVRKGTDDYVFVLVPAHREIGWRKLRTHLGVSRASLPERGQAEEVTGYRVGTITPFGARRKLPVVADVDAERHPIVALGGGEPGVNIHVAPQQLRELLNADFADVTRPSS